MDVSKHTLGLDSFIRFKAISTYLEHLRLSHFRVQPVAFSLLEGLVAYVALLVIYRLYLSPIAGFPGPKLAAATEWYEFYHSIVLDGQWGKAVDDMHKKYGPIVRTTPWELSIRDSDFYHKLYVAGNTRRTDMWARGREGNGFEDSHHLTVPHDLHRQRRKPLESFFSRQGITRVESIIAQEAKTLEERLRALSGTDNIVHLDHAFTALTGDIVGRVACGATPGLVEDADFSPGWHNLMIKTVLIGPVLRCFTWLNSLIQFLPTSVMAKIYPEGISNIMIGKTGKDYIESIKDQIRTGKLESGDTKKSVFHHLLTSPIPESEKTTKRLQAESMIFLIAGTVTSAETLAMIVYHILSNPKIQQRLQKDLKSVMDGYPASMPAWADLEKIPYLQGCIKEALRMYGLVGNLARRSPDVALQYKEWTIPKNTPVGMSIYAMHTDPEVFPDPLRFAPERWLGDYNPAMDRNFVAFTKGSRSCLGINLAMAELYLTTAMVLRPGGPKLTLYETDDSDVRIVRDFVKGFPKPESRGIRVKVN